MPVAPAANHWPMAHPIRTCLKGSHRQRSRGRRARAPPLKAGSGRSSAVNGCSRACQCSGCIQGADPAQETQQNAPTGVIRWACYELCHAKRSFASAPNPDANHPSRPIRRDTIRPAPIRQPRAARAVGVQHRDLSVAGPPRRRNPRRARQRPPSRPYCPYSQRHRPTARQCRRGAPCHAMGGRRCRRCAIQSSHSAYRGRAQRRRRIAAGDRGLVHREYHAGRIGTGSRCAGPGAGRGRANLYR